MQTINTPNPVLMSKGALECIFFDALKGGLAEWKNDKFMRPLLERLEKVVGLPKVVMQEIAAFHCERRGAETDFDFAYAVNARLGGAVDFGFIPD